MEFAPAHLAVLTLYLEGEGVELQTGYNAGPSFVASTMKPSHPSLMRF